MLDLRHQIRDYIDESADPVTIEDVFFARAEREADRTAPKTARPPLRRPWVIAVVAAAVTALLFGLVPRLMGDSTTPSTVPPATTSPTPTTTPATTTTTSSAPPTTVAAVVLPDGYVVPIDHELGTVLADLLLAADDLGWSSPITLLASLEPGGEPGPDEQQLWLEQPHVLVTMSSERRKLIEGGWVTSQISAPGSDGFSFDVATVRVFATVDEATKAAEVLMDEILQGIPRVVQEQTAFDLVDAGDESAASFFTLGDSALASLVVRDGSWVVSMRFSSDWPATVEPGTALLDALASDEAQTELRAFLDAILGARGRGANQDVSRLWVPLVPPSADAQVYEHGWKIVADLPASSGEPESVERNHMLGVTPSSVRCRFWQVPFGEIEPQREIQYLDDGSGTISLSERDGSEFVLRAELPPDDPGFIETMAACRRFEPVSEVLDLIGSAWPSVPAAAEQAVNGEANRTSSDTWVVVEREQERAFGLDPSLLATLGISDGPVPADIEITRWFAWISADSVQFELNATGNRSTMEAVFGVDLSDVPDDGIEFTFGFDFSLRLDG